MASGISRVRRVRRSMVITKLPYVTKIYINYQVLIPASLVKALNIENVTYANITIKYRGLEIEIPQVRLLRTRNTASRQFTIPKEVREKYGISPPLDEVEVLDIKPA